MLTFTRKLSHCEDYTTTMTLPYDTRQKSRFREKLDDGQPAAVILERGKIIRSGECLCSDEGMVVLIQAADESVSSVHLTDTLLLARAAYHLGNRHVALQIGDQSLRYQHDHVLDDMLRGMGIEVTSEMAPFEPEAGAYSHHAHHHDHPHG